MPIRDLPLNQVSIRLMAPAGTLPTACQSEAGREGLVKSEVKIKIFSVTQMEENVLKLKQNICIVIILFPKNIF